MKWISPKTITGEAATGDCYFRRQAINDYFWSEVKKGNHILFVAPRRVGKTSIMKDLEKNCPEGFVGIYDNIEGVLTQSEFYKRLFELVLRGINRSTFDKAKHFVKQCLGKYKIKEISPLEIKFESTDINYEAEIKYLISNLKETDVRTVIFLDEFAEVISKLNKQDAIEILHKLREMRHNDNFKHFTIVYAGSIGLHSVIRKIARPKLINDLHPVHINPLSETEAIMLIKQLTEGVTMQLSPFVINYLFKTIQNLLPYYIQLMLAKLDEIAKSKNEPNITETMVDTAFKLILQKNENFEDWIIRLINHQAEAFPFMNEILKHTAHKGTITIQEIYDKAASEEFKRTEDYMDYIDLLESEGYLQKTENQSYQFLSSFLQNFWLNKYPIYRDKTILQENT